MYICRFTSFQNVSSCTDKPLDGETCISADNTHYIYIYIYIYIYSTICRHAHVSAFHASSVQLWYMLERDDHRTYTHESALTRRMWYSTVTPTDPDMRRVSWGQSALTTTREVSFALWLVDTHELRRVLNNTEVKERNSTICRHAHVSAFHASSVQLWYMLERDDHRTYTHESALTRRMWYSTVTPTDPDMRRVSWGQSALTTTREVSFALWLVDTHELRRVLNNTEVKERNSTICRHAHVSAFHASSVQLWYMLERDDHRTYTHESALTRRMWYSTVTPTDPDMRRVSWGQSALTTTREVSLHYG